MSHLAISVLGPLEVALAGTLVSTLETVKVRALLAYLAVESDRPNTRASLVGLLWPEYPEDSARHNLRQALFNLRTRLGDQNASPPYFLITRESIQINRNADYSLDLDRFNQLANKCLENFPQCIEDGTTHAAELEEMVKLYRGEFLQQLSVGDSSEFDEWLMWQRESVHQHIVEAHRYLAKYYELQGDYQASRQHAARQLELDPWREEAHLQLMRVLALDGQRAAAIAQYETCRRILAEELDMKPSPETLALSEQIRQGSLSFEQPLSFRPRASQIRLPPQSTPFIGRKTELRQLSQHLQDPGCRCLTLLGPGGIGKTRLALQVAESERENFRQGAAFVSLASVNSTADAILAIANATSFSFIGPGDLKTHLLEYLRQKQILLILDSVEHLLIDNEQHENIAQIIVGTLHSAPKVIVLVTSREKLNIQEEIIFEVGGLPYPETGQVERLSDYDAVTLFIQRARRAFPNFLINDENRSEIARICRLVEGMPLAIELAATWIRILSPVEIAHEIENNLDFLSAEVRDLPVRHRSIRVVFDHSWQLLSTEEQQVLCKLSVFRGGFDRQAAEKIAGATLAVLSTLVNRSLLRCTTVGRYDLHGLIRQYSADRLAADLRLKLTTKQSHCAYYLDFAEMANQGLQHHDQLEWLSRLELEHDNLRVALNWTLKNDPSLNDSEELGFRLVTALRWFWRLRDHFHEGCDWLSKVLQHFPERHTVARAGALLTKSLMLNAIGDLSGALPPAEESIVIYRDFGAKKGLAEALMIEGLTLLWQGKADPGREAIRESLETYLLLGDRWGEAMALYRLGSYLADYSSAPAGKTMLEESASILESLSEKYLYTSVLTSLGIADMKIGEYASAQTRFEAAIRDSKAIRHPWGLADVLTHLGYLYRIKGDYSHAQECFDEALGVYQEHGYNIWQIEVFCAMSENAIVQGNFSLAHTHLTAADSLVNCCSNNLLGMLVKYSRGSLAYYEGDYELAARLLEETADEARNGQFLSDLARSLVGLGKVRLGQGQPVLASETIQEGLKIFWEIGQKIGYIDSLEVLASAYVAQGHEAEAVKLYAPCDVSRQALGAPLLPVDQPGYLADISACQHKLGIDNFSDLWQCAASQPINDVIEEILKAA